MNEDIRQLYIYLVKKKCKLDFGFGFFSYAMYGDDGIRYLSFGVANTNRIVKKFNAEWSNYKK